MQVLFYILIALKVYKKTLESKAGITLSSYCTILFCMTLTNSTQTLHKLHNLHTLHTLHKHYTKYSKTVFF